MGERRMFFKNLISGILFLTLYACSSGDSNTTQNVTDNKTTAELPAGMQKLSLGNNGSLSAYATIDGDTVNRITMDINPAGAGSATLTIAGLTRAIHTITITYEYTSAGVTYIVATAGKSIDLSTGSARLSFFADDYDTQSYDTDSDGSSNAAELKSGTNPSDQNDFPHLAFSSGFTASVGENTTSTGYQASATAADTDPVSYNITGGLDQVLFSIDQTTGILSFKRPADFERPTDSNQDNIYEVNISAIDGLVELTQSVFITVTDVIEIAGARPFITVWKTDNPGVTPVNQVKIGTLGDGYNYSIDWGDTTSNNNVTGDITHSYPVPGIYTIRISGSFPRIFFNRTEHDNDKLISLEQWGDIQWRTMNNAFFSCGNMLGNATDTPDLSQVTDMNSMFRGASGFNQDISNWNVSFVTDMSFMFRGAGAFNQDIGNWNVSAVKNMNSMFDGAIAFNKPLNNWPVSLVEDMGLMFNGASAFNQDLSNWSTLLVTDMQSMFNGARAFDQSLSSWDVSAVKNMTNMLNGVTLSTENYDALLLGWSKLNLQRDINFNAGKSLYSDNSQTARDSIISTFLWTINDGGFIAITPPIIPPDPSL